MHTMTAEDKMLSVEDVAEYLGLSSDTVLRKLNQGLLIGYNLEGTWRIKQSDLTAYLEERKSVTRTRRKRKQ